HEASTGVDGRQWVWTAGSCPEAHAIRRLSGAILIDTGAAPPRAPFSGTEPKLGTPQLPDGSGSEPARGDEARGTMAQTLTGRKRVRKFFGKITEIAEMPN